ncbi:MAG: OB-fold domain-containing protein [Alphaproteobacteria bacterium]|nr:OB-fold domain-containing protein [Alphaproteobacteria bacterium]
MTAYGKPLPVPDADSRHFWAGCRSHRLLLQRCRSCGTHRFPAGALCPACRSREADWIESRGRGTVFSWITVRHPVPRDVYAADVPYVVALVDLEEGVRMATNIVGCAPEEVTAGMPVEVAFEDVTAEISLPRFRPAAGR